MSSYLSGCVTANMSSEVEKAFDAEMKAEMDRESPPVSPMPSIPLNNEPNNKNIEKVKSNKSGNNLSPRAPGGKKVDKIATSPRVQAKSKSPNAMPNKNIKIPASATVKVNNAAKNPDESDEEPEVVYNNVASDNLHVAPIDWDKFGDVNQLHNKIQNLTEALASKESEVDTLSEALLQLKDEISVMESSDVQIAAKDMARRNKKLNLELERERSKNRLLAEQCANMSTLSKDSKEFESTKKEKDKGVEDEEATSEALHQEITMLKAKYNLANRRMLDSKQLLVDQKAEVVRLTRLLTREVGDENINEILSASDLVSNQNSNKANWVGRSQKILTLQAKIKELQQQLSLSDPSVYQDLLNQQAQDRQRQKAENLQRSAEMERIASERKEAMEGFSIMKQKHDAISSRNKVLEKEQSSMRSKLKLLVDKSEADDKLIDELRSQIGKRPKTIESLNQPSVIRAASQNHSFEDAELRRQVSAQNEQLENQKRIIIALRDEMNKLRSSRQNQNVHQIESFDKADYDQQLQFALLEAQKAKELASLYKKQVEERARTANVPPSKSLSNRPNSREINHIRAPSNSLQLDMSKIKKSNESSKSPTVREILIDTTRSASRMSDTNRLGAKSSLGYDQAPTELERARSSTGVIRGKADVLIVEELRNELHSKEEELEVCQELLTQMRILHQKAISDLRARVDQIR